MSHGSCLAPGNFALCNVCHILALSVPGDEASVQVKLYCGLFSNYEPCDHCTTEICVPWR